MQQSRLLPSWRNIGGRSVVGTVKSGNVTDELAKCRIVRDVVSSFSSHALVIALLWDRWCTWWCSSSSIIYRNGNWFCCSCSSGNSFRFDVGIAPVRTNSTEISTLNSCAANSFCGLQLPEKSIGLPVNGQIRLVAGESIYLVQQYPVKVQKCLWPLIKLKALATVYYDILINTNTNPNLMHTLYLNNIW